MNISTKIEREELFALMLVHRKVYYVAETGDVWKLKGQPFYQPKHVKANKHPVTGFYYVKLSDGGKTVSVLLHRLVAMVLLTPRHPQITPHVLHADGNFANNHPHNLVWVQTLPEYEQNRISIGGTWRRGRTKKLSSQASEAVYG